LRQVLPTRSAGLKRLKQAGCRTLTDFEHLITRHFIRSVGDMRYGWAKEKGAPRLSQTTWQKLLSALERAGFNWGDYWLP
jgi:hypothetical protein